MSSLKVPVETIAALEDAFNNCIEALLKYCSLRQRPLDRHEVYTLYDVLFYLFYSIIYSIILYFAILLLCVIVYLLSYIAIVYSIMSYIYIYYYVIVSFGGLVSRMFPGVSRIRRLSAEQEQVIRGGRLALLQMRRVADAHRGANQAVSAP